MNFKYKTEYIHLFFISLLAIHYVLPLIFFGQVVVYPHDNLDGGVVYDHIISKIYKGNTESINYLLSGNIKWYYFEEIFYPINILHYILNDKLFYFTDEIIKKVLAYFSFYILAKSLDHTKFNSALGGILYSTIISIKMPLGLGLPFLPYILYLLINKNSINKKHYFFLFLVGLNSSLIQDIFPFVFLIPLSIILKSKKNNFKIYLQVFSVIIIALLLSNIHLIIGSVLSEPIHREAWVNQNNILLPFIESFTHFFTYINYKNSYFLFYVPVIILTTLLFFLSMFSKHREIKLIFLFIIFILVLRSLLHHNIIDTILIGILEIFKGYNFQRLDRILPITTTLLFVLFISNLRYINFKKTLLFLSFLSIFSLQLKIPLPEIGQYILKKNMHEKKFNEAKKYFLEKKYINFVKISFDKKNYDKLNKIDFDFSSIKTFDNYYKFKDYTFIKNIVENSKTMSIGLDPMVAVMNDIRVIDGYHSIYPLSYKIKFRKIIEKELENNIKLKNYYDNWGSRVYAFYSDQKNIKLNFQSAKSLGASYIISQFPINNTELEIVCYKCNNSSQIFLYRIL